MFPDLFDPFQTVPHHVAGECDLSPLSPFHSLASLRPSSPFRPRIQKAGRPPPTVRDLYSCILYSLIRHSLAKGFREEPNRTTKHHNTLKFKDTKRYGRQVFPLRPTWDYARLRQVFRSPKHTSGKHEESPAKAFRRGVHESLSGRGSCGIKGMGTKNPRRKGRGYRDATGKKDDMLKAFNPVNGKGFRENKDDL